MKIGEGSVCQGIDWEQLRVTETSRTSQFSACGWTKLKIRPFSIETFRTLKVALIIQAKASPDVCGVILDAVQIKRTDKNFEFRCFDPQAPTDVIPGTAIRNETTPNLVMAIDAGNRFESTKVHSRSQQGGLLAPTVLMARTRVAPHGRQRQGIRCTPQTRTILRIGSGLIGRVAHACGCSSVGDFGGSSDLFLNFVRV